MPTAADVPNKFDCVINGQGYLCADMQDVKGEFAINPTFITRQNTQGDYGDNQQDFWMTYTQRDWSLGEQQRYQGRDDDGKRRYWTGTNVNVVDVPGQVSIRPLTNNTSAFGEAIRLLTGGTTLDNNMYAIGATHLYSIDSGGTISDKGAHGLGAAPECFVRGGDATGAGAFFSTTSGGSVGIRRWSGAAFSTFSASKFNQLEFLNNTLYGVTLADSTLWRIDTAGTATSQYVWKEATGTAIQDTTYIRLKAFGGKLLILRPSDPLGSLLYLYEATGPAVIAGFDRGFIGLELEVLEGTAFIAGVLLKYSSGAVVGKPAIYYYSNGTIGKLWQAQTYISSTSFSALGPMVRPQMVAYNSGLVFTDDSTGKFMFYDPANGGISSIGSYTYTDETKIDLDASNLYFLHSRFTTTPYRHPADGTSTSATVTTSLADFDSSLTKLFRGIRIDFDSATDGNGGTVDISYRVGDVDGSYTSLQTGAASGTEYTLSGVTGRSLSVKVTLNKGTSTAGPVLKRIAVRAAPQLPTGPSGAGFRKFTLVLDLHGVKAPLEGGMMRLRDDTVHNKSGAEMATNLFTAAASTSPVSVTTELHGTISTMLVDQENFKVQRVHKNEYLAYVPLREV